MVGLDFNNTESHPTLIRQLPSLFCQHLQCCLDAGRLSQAVWLCLTDFGGLVGRLLESLILKQRL